MIDSQNIKKFLLEKVNGYTNESVLAFRASMPDLNPELLVPNRSYSDYNLPEAPFGADAFIRCVYGKTNMPYPMWEIVNNDFCFYKPNTSVYYTSDGYVCRLSQSINNVSHDWEMYLKTYNFNQTANLIEMEEPIHKEIVHSNYISYMYTVVKRPQLWELIEPSIIHESRELTMDVYKQIIDLVSNYIELMKIVYDNDPRGLPEDGASPIQLRLKPNWKSAGVNGIFVDFKRYNINFTQFVQKSYSHVYDYCQYMSHYSQTDNQSLLDYTLNLYSNKFGIDKLTISTHG